MACFSFCIQLQMVFGWSFQTATKMVHFFRKTNETMINVNIPFFSLLEEKYLFDAYVYVFLWSCSQNHFDVITWFAYKIWASEVHLVRFWYEKRHSITECWIYYDGVLLWRGFTITRFTMISYHADLWDCQYWFFPRFLFIFSFFSFSLFFHFSVFFS